ncbi:MAG: hypothetical protein Q9172_003073 [Xanthocarpia lactea]
MEGSGCHVLVIGGGLCGLGAAISIALEGHRVSVFERASEPHQFGAGIQITPNGLRILRRWGVTDKLESKATIPESISIIRYDGQKVLAHRDDYDEELASEYGEPIWCLHRIDLQQALAVRAKEVGVRLLFNSPICHVDTEGPAVICENGCREDGDLVVAADGLWSGIRRSFLGENIVPQPTGDLAYRIVLSTDEVERDPELWGTMAGAKIRIWLGPEAHAVAYGLCGGQMLNIVLLVRDDLPQDIDRATANLGEMVKLFEGWDPLLTKLLPFVKNVDKWRLMYLRIDERWTSEQGTFLMAGDSCHSMLPYMAQGANM